MENWVIQNYLGYILFRIWPWVKNRSKTERQTVSSWDINPWSNFCDSHWEFICCKKWHLGTSKIYMPPEIVVGTHFHVQSGTKTNLVLLTADGETFWPLLPILVSVLSGCTVQPKNTLYPQGDRSGLRKPKKDKHQY